MPVVMDADRVSRALTRIAHEIVERNRGVADLALVGVRSRGVPLARRLAQTLKQISGEDVPTGALDITLYRDDLMRHQVGPQPVVRKTEIAFSIDNRTIAGGRPGSLTANFMKEFRKLTLKEGTRYEINKIGSPA